LTTKISYYLLLLILTLCGSLLLSGNVFSQDCGCVDCPVAIEDQSISIATFVVEGADNNSLNTNEIQTVFIKFRHSYPAELQMRLISPAGQAVTLIGPQGTAASSIFFGGFNVSFVSDIINTDPDPGMSSVWNNSDLSGINQYTGAYLPHSGSLQNFNTGTVNGDWLLEITDPIQFDIGELTEFTIIFKDQAGIDCCEAEAGDMDLPPLIACPGADTLLLDIMPSFIGSGPNSTLYGYTYLVSLDGILIAESEQPDLRFSPSGIYQIYGLSYELLDTLLLPIPNGTLDISAIQNLIGATDPLLCADLTDNFFEVTILEGDTEVLLQDTICQGDTLVFGSDSISMSGIYRDTFSLSESCDSIVILDLLVAQPDVTLSTALTCESNLTGLDTIFLVNQFSCDSLIITETLLLPNDTLYVQEQTCDPLFAGQIDTLVLSTPECDSIIITSLFYESPDTTFLFQKSCIPNEVGIDTTTVSSDSECEDIQIVQTDLYLVDTTFFERITCDPNEQDSLISFFPTDTCDRVEITTFTFATSDTTLVSDTTCSVAEVGLDTLFLTNSFGCDSLIIFDILFVESDTSRIEQFSCDSADVGVDTTFFKNENDCDSLLILTTFFSPADTTYIQALTCDINQTEPIEASFATETCDSIVVTNFVYSAPDTTFLSLISCEENLIPDTTILQNQFSCDSLVISTYIFSVPDPTEVFEKTCDPNQVGIFSDTLAGVFCDSIITTVFSLSERDTTRLTEFVCAQEEARIDTLFLTNQENCDSIILTTFIWEPIEPTIISIFTCDVEQLGSDTTFLTSVNDCDSLLISEFIFSNSDTTYLPLAFTCDPAEVNSDTTFFATSSCDSIVIETTLLLPLDTTFVMESSCDINMEIVDTMITSSVQGCDSIIVTTIQALFPTQSFMESPTTDPTQIGLDTMILINEAGCDSLVITDFFLTSNPSDTTVVNLLTCDPDLLLDTTTNADGSVLITIPLLDLIDTTFIQETTCDINQAPAEVIQLMTPEGCDSIVVVLYDFVSVDTLFNSIPSCTEIPQDTFVNTTGECFFVEINTYINQSTDTNFIDFISCVGPFGLDTLMLQTDLGCDSLVITSTTEASSSETNIFVSSCLPNVANDTVIINGQFCDSLVITNFIHDPIPPDPIPPTMLSINTCDESLLGIVIDTLISQQGCDSLVITNYVSGAFQTAYEVSIQPPSCTSFADATVDILSDDDIPVLWLFDDLEAMTRDDLAAGDYMIRLGQAACDTLITITIPEGEDLSAGLDVTYQPCSTVGGNIAIIPTSGFGPYDYTWDDGAMDSIRIDLVDGVYTVTVSDALSCSTTISAEIINVTGLDVDTDIEHVSCFGFADGSIMITLLSGTAPYTEEWSDGGESLFRDSLPAGNYSVTIRDVNDCNVTLNRAVQEPPLLVLDIELTAQEEIVVTPTGGTPPYVYLWNDGTTIDRITNPIAGFEYQVTVTDANDCTSDANELYQTDAVRIIDNNDVDVFPNPASQKLFVAFQENLHLQELILYDIHGRKVYSKIPLQQNSYYSMSVSDLASGTYILEALFIEGVFRQKVLLLRE